MQPIFSNSCAISGCHTGGSPAGSMNLSSGQSYSNLVGVPVNAAACSTRIRVVAGNVAASYIIDKLLGNAGICGNMMPARGVSLTTAELDLIRGWICEGAPNN